MAIRAFRPGPRHCTDSRRGFEAASEFSELHDCTDQLNSSNMGHNGAAWTGLLQGFVFAFGLRHIETGSADQLCLRIHRIARLHVLRQVVASGSYHRVQPLA